MCVSTKKSVRTRMLAARSRPVCLRAVFAGQCRAVQREGVLQGVAVPIYSGRSHRRWTHRCNARTFYQNVSFLAAQQTDTTHTQIPVCRTNPQKEDPKQNHGVHCTASSFQCHLVFWSKMCRSTTESRGTLHCF